MRFEIKFKVRKAVKGDYEVIIKLQEENPFGSVDESGKENEDFVSVETSI